MKSGLRKYNAARSRPYRVVEQKRRRAAGKSPGHGLCSEDEDLPDSGELSREVYEYLTDLNTGASSKMSVLKMQVVKADENISTMSRLG